MSEFGNVTFRVSSMDGRSGLRMLPLSVSRAAPTPGGAMPSELVWAALRRGAALSKAASKPPTTRTPTMQSPGACGTTRFFISCVSAGGGAGSSTDEGGSPKRDGRQCTGHRSGALGDALFRRVRCHGLPPCGQLHLYFCRGIVRHRLPPALHLFKFGLRPEVADDALCLTRLQTNPRNGFLAGAGHVPHATALVPGRPQQAGDAQGAGRYPQSRFPGVGGGSDGMDLSFFLPRIMALSNRSPVSLRRRSPSLMALPTP